MPDRFETLDRSISLPQTTRPVWMIVDVPRGTAPGTYKGQVEVRAKGKAPQLLNLEIVVQKQLLPIRKTGNTVWTYGRTRGPWHGTITWNRGHQSIRCFSSSI